MVTSFRVSVTHAAATIALVLGMAGMMFFTTPWVREIVTPWMENSSARCAAFEFRRKVSVLYKQTGRPGFGEIKFTYLFENPPHVFRVVAVESRHHVVRSRRASIARAFLI